MRTNSSEYIIPFSSIGFCKGVNIGCLYDFERKKIYHVPNYIIELIFEKRSTLNDLKSIFKNQKNDLKDNLDYLFKKEIIFFADNVQNFPKLNLKFERPYLVDVCLLEIDDLQNFKLDFIQKYTNELGLIHIILICKKKQNQSEIFNKMQRILNIVENSKIQHVSLFLEFDEIFNYSLFSLFDLHYRFREIIFYNTKKNNIISQYDNLIYQESSLEELLSRPIQSVNDLDLDLHTYIESNSFNIFFNRKIYLDNDGFLKYNINKEANFININEINFFKNFINSNYFDLWKIKKDQILVCKDCQYRLICPDSRIPIKKNNFYEHKEECKFNPYTNNWQ